ncbi:MAG TPA: glycosyltransferase [Candidatus Woesebacteria bacterium]|nr:glycosyltransferase [Candidatus Woesebacteria bacterium]
MKISIINHNLSDNSLGRAYILALMLKRYYQVEILGPSINNKIWEPIAFDTSIKYVQLSTKLHNISKNLKKIDGDIIYAIKPYGTSFGYALLKKFLSNKPVILDEDDWDFGFFLDNVGRSILLDLLKVNFFDPNNGLYTYLLSKLSFFADDITVSSTFLQKQFGGTIIPHARDKEMYKINQNKVQLIQKRYNPKSQKIIMFLGTVRQHKGIDLIISAMDSMNRKDLSLFLIGNKDLIKQFVPNRNYITIIPTQRFDNLANILSIADLIVLPQKNTHSAKGQIPAKLFDAMAMGKPIIASNVSDISLILKDCGLIFEPDNSNELIKKMNLLLYDNNLANILGAKAKAKFLKKYSFDTVAPILLSIFNKIEKKYGIK